MSRESILNGLRSYRAPAPEENIAHVEVPREQMIDRFVGNLQDAHAEVIRCGAGEARPRLHRLLQEKSVKRICAGRDAVVRPYLENLPEDLELIRYDEPVELLCRDLFASIDAGLTTCAGGIAETGTLVMYSSPDQPRLLSLVPPIHIAVLGVDQLHADMGSWLASVDVKNPPSNMVLISGPSKSADIEQVLAYGVHGPKQLVVLLVG